MAGVGAEVPALLSDEDQEDEAPCLSPVKYLELMRRGRTLQSPGPNAGADRTTATLAGLPRLKKWAETRYNGGRSAWDGAAVLATVSASGGRTAPSLCVELSSCANLAGWARHSCVKVAPNQRDPLSRFR